MYESLRHWLQIFLLLFVPFFQLAAFKNLPNNTAPKTGALGTAKKIEEKKKEAKKRANNILQIIAKIMSQITGFGYLKKKAIVY